MNRQLCIHVGYQNQIAFFKLLIGVYEIISNNKGEEKYEC